jgi:ribosomal protein S27AE
MPYLMLEAGSYQLSWRQMYEFSECQFCGSGDFLLRFFDQQPHRNQSQRGIMAHVLARRSCSKCHKTTALVKSNID